MLQSKLLPIYFALQSLGSAIALATLYYSGTGVLKPQLATLGEFCSGCRPSNSLLIVLASLSLSCWHQG